MKLSRELYKQIEKINKLLIQTSFSTSFNYPAEKDGIITWTDFKDISFALKNQPYDELYNECLKEKAYNFILLDGALIQLMYTCDDKSILKHRLAYYPNPDLERFCDSPEDYEETHYGKNLFSDIINRKIVAFPIRFDFDFDKEKYVEHDHTYSHLTLGNYTSCRIPVARPLTPNKFILFILRSFYLEKFNASFKMTDFDCEMPIDFVISKGEAKYLHISH